MRFVSLSVRCACALAWVIAAAGASAQVILYDQPDLRGAKLTIRGQEPNLDDSDFNHRAQSLSVRGGIWEICVESSFRGDCMRLQPGDYPTLDRRFTRSISSLRPVDGGTSPVYQGQGSPQRPQGQAMPPPVTIIVPPPPSTCSLGATSVCPACSITCTGGQRAFCQPGYEYLKFGTLSCEFQPTCQCRPGV